MEFEKPIEYEKDVIAQLYEKNVIHESTFQLLTLAQEHRAYITGGFASRYANVVFAKTSISDLKWTTTTNISRERLEWKKFSTYHDIDLWFRTKKEQEEFVANVKRLYEFIDHKDSSAGFADEFYCYDHNDKNAQIVQAIRNICGEPHEVTSVFDIYNAACVIDRKNLYVPKNYQWLLDNDCIHVQNWNNLRGKNLTIHRLAKWLRGRNDIKNMTSSTVKYIEQNLLDLVNVCRTGPRIPKGDNVPSLSVTFEPIMKYLSQDTILLLASCYNSGESYNSTVSIFDLLKKKNT